MTEPANPPRKICFMVMPYGVRDSGVSHPDLPAKIDFDRLWFEGYAPALSELGYDPVRADMDSGALIIKEMLERLVISDVVCADITIPNGNVYYEIGVRHAAQKHGCVLFSADWSKPLFDIDQMPRLSYPLNSSLNDGSLGDDAIRLVRDVIKEKFQAMVEGASPVFQSVFGYPEADPKTSDAFASFVKDLSAVQGKVRAVRKAAKSKRGELTRALANEIAVSEQTPSAVALELLFLLRDEAGWKETTAFIESLPSTLKETPLVREQLALAQSKSGDHHQAIAGLEALIELAGETSERRGLLRGRYKKMMREAENPDDADEYLNRAIENYERGCELDLNDHYPTCNLPRLYRQRGDIDDEKAAQSAAAITLAAVHRAKARNPHNEWINPTLLGAAFDDGNVNEAKSLYQQIKREGAAQWKLETTLSDLKASIELQPDKAIAEGLREVYDRLEGLVG